MGDSVRQPVIRAAFMVALLLSVLSMAASSHMGHLPACTVDGQVATCDGSGNWIQEAASGGGGSGADCVAIPMISPCPQGASTACTMMSGVCAEFTDMDAGPVIYGNVVTLNTDYFKYYQLKVMGRNKAGQTGTVTFTLVLDATTNLISTDAGWVSGQETCAARNSGVSDQSALTGDHTFYVTGTNSVGNDDPGMSSVVMVACRSTFS